MTLVVGTAGHIDHGKTTLLRALTGIDADRLPEEQRRGMTIDVGYAHLRLADGREIDFVDVPGHDRLIGNMLVGAGEIDAALIVVAADDGPRAQTIEHLELLDALGVRTGVVAITKADAVDPGRVAEVFAAIADLVAGTSLAGSPVLAVSGVRGEGLAELVAALAVMAADRGGAAHAGPRLAVDRAFPVRGRGVVVTGTLRGGTIERGDVLAVEPGGRSVRVREVQVHGQAVERAGEGRVALNVSGPDAPGLRRGDVLAALGIVTTTDRLLARLRPPATLGMAGGRTRSAADALASPVRLHVGTDQVGARIGRASREAVALENGDRTAILRLDRPIAAATGDRFVLRRPSPGETLAGGVILDVAPPRGVSRRRFTLARLERLVATVDAPVAEASAGDEAMADARLELHGAVGSGGAIQLAADVADAGRQAAMAAAVASAGVELEAGGVPLATVRVAVAAAIRSVATMAAADATAAAARLIDELIERGELERAGDRVATPGRRLLGPDPLTLAAMDRLVALLDVPAPPSVADAVRAAGSSEAALRALEREGRIVRPESDLAWSREAWERLARTALDAAVRGPLTPAALRDATGTSRKYVMALLEDLDRRGILARTPAGHVPGPRAGSLPRQPVA